MNIITTKLRSWQGVEWLYSLIWGIGRWVAIAGVALALACSVDWLIDRTQDTPFAVRVLLTAAQILLALLTLYLLVFRFKVPSIDALAARAEGHFRQFDHRLVTALQLNRQGEKLQGMSPQLLAAVTQEAEQLAGKHSFTALADKRRLLWTAGLIVPLVLIVGLFAIINSPLLLALLQRQALMDVEIPRSTQLVNKTPELWPSGDEVEIQVEAAGNVGEAPGALTVLPEGQPSERFPLTFKSRTAEGVSLFTAKLPPSSVPFRFRARLADARLRKPGQVRFAPRPVVKEINAWVLLPKYVDPTGMHTYERFQPQGEVVALQDSSVRVEITTSKAVEKANLLLFTRDETGKEQKPKSLPMQLDNERTAAGIVFDLPTKPTAYQIEVIDENGFANSNQPRRGITLAPDDPPRVNLLNEVLKDPRDEGPVEDYEVNGMPIVLGGQVMIGYSARSPLGLSRAVLQYRVNEGPWTPLTLKTTTADLAKLGPFLPELGVFRESGLTGQVEFYPIPSNDPTSEPSGLEAGGRINFQTAALQKVDEKGKATKLEVGDRVEFYVEVYDRNPAANRLPGRSESRLKGVVTQAQLQAWRDQLDQSQERLKKLEESQRGVFGKKSR